MMTTNPQPTFVGPLAASLSGWVAEQQALGYHYTRQIHELSLFDRWSVAIGHAEATLPQVLVEQWTAKRAHESEATRQRRVSLLCGFAHYMQRCGLPAWSPPHQIATPRYVPHIFTRAELAALFTALDACAPDPRSPYRHRVFPLLFRVLYGTGMRISEALSLTRSDFDATAMTLYIRRGKGDKERCIPVHSALADALDAYVCSLPGVDRNSPLFPNPHGQVYNTKTLYAVFRRFLWAAGISHGGRGKGPRLHDIRYPNLKKMPTFFTERCDSSHCATKGWDFVLSLAVLLIGHQGV